MWRKFILLIASGGGLGLIAPFAPGTFGSLLGVVLSFAVAALSLWWQLPMAAGLAVLAIPICGEAEKIFGIKDDGRITADEWMLFPIATVGLPLLELPWWSMLCFFVVVRVVDIIKPYPANRLQSLPGGLGVVIDDAIANLYSLAVNWAIYWLLFR